MWRFSEDERREKGHSRFSGTEKPGGSVLRSKYQLVGHRDISGYPEYVQHVLMKWQLIHMKNMTVYAGKRLEIGTFRHIHLENSKF